MSTRATGRERSKPGEALARERRGAQTTRRWKKGRALPRRARYNEKPTIEPFDAEPSRKSTADVSHFFFHLSFRPGGRSFSSAGL